SGRLPRQVAGQELAGELLDFAVIAGRGGAKGTYDLVSLALFQLDEHGLELLAALLARCLDEFGRGHVAPRFLARASRIGGAEQGVLAEHARGAHIVDDVGMARAADAGTNIVAGKLQELDVVGGGEDAVELAGDADGGATVFDTGGLVEPAD